MPLTNADLAAQTLQAAGVRHVFGHPGGEVIDFIDALERRGIRFVLTGHEAAASFMAGAVGRLTGAPGVCLATLGPGALNLALGVACAYLDRDPLLAFSARTATARIHRSPKQNLSLNDIFAPFVKWSVALDGAGTGRTINTALQIATTPPRGPAYLTLPADVAASPDRPNSTGPISPGSPAPDDRVFDTIVRALNAAKRPIGVIGLALDSRHDTEAVRRFFAEAGLPHTTLPQSKGVADEDAPNFLGTVAHGAGDEAIVEWLRQSDCLLGVGFDPVESAHDWHFRAPLYSLANAPIGFDQYQPAAECVGSVSALLERLRPAYRGSSQWTEADLAGIRRRVAEGMIPSAESGPAGLAPYHLVHRIRETMPPDTIATTDVGAHKMLMGQAWTTRQPGAFLVSNGLSAMGYAVPSALAAALTYPDRPVVCVTGDGGFGMMVQELETARRLGLKPLFVVLCDRSLAVIKFAQWKRNLLPRGVDFAPVDWARVADGFGAVGLTATTLPEVERALSDWLAHRQLTVLAVPVDENLYAGLMY